MIDDYMTVREAAEYLHVTRYDVYYHIKHGHLPAKAIGGQPDGMYAAYVISKDDIKAFREYQNRAKKKPKPKKTPAAVHLYEIVLISCGQVTTLFKTCSHRELSRRYTELMEHGHKFIRVRADGEMLTIHESDKLAAVYNPRIKRGAEA